MARAVARARRLVLFSDFDGTLAPIVRYPWQARLPSATRSALSKLARIPHVTVGVVSGRALADVRRLVKLETICYIGSHGLEWVVPGRRPRLWATPAERRRMGEIARKLRRVMRGLPGVWVERKPASVTLHYRAASPRDGRRAMAEVAGVARAYGSQLRLLHGMKVVELLPAGAASKGAAVEAMLNRLGSSARLLLYLGDDPTDESVFARLGNNDFSIFVGRPRPTRARFRLASPRQVCEFLQRLRRMVS